MFYIKYTINANTLFLFGVITLMISCKKFVEIEAPKTEVVTELVFSNDETAKSAMSGIYSEMVNGSNLASGGFTSITHLAGLSSDEFINYNASQDIVAFYTTSLLPTNGPLRSGLWQPAYKYIYYVNAIIEGVTNAENITSATKNQLRGESLFLRAFYYFYLVNIFGDVPLVTTTDYRVNATASRGALADVYKQITSDLTEAQSLLPDNFTISGGERVRPCKAAATAMLARVHLYQQDWVSAESQSSLVINDSSIFKLTNLKDVFLANSKEAIWQLRPVASGQNTKEGQLFILNNAPSNVSLSTALTNSFEAGDQRRVEWVKSFVKDQLVYLYPTKYKVSGTAQALTEYSMVLRVAEQYLIRAEARLKLHNTVGALSDLNAIRKRAGLLAIEQATENDLAVKLEQEKRIELFSEWGHRWFDLKRSDRASAVLGPVKGANWEATDVLYPVPQNERINNQHISQNPGYN